MMIPPARPGDPPCAAPVFEAAAFEVAPAGVAAFEAVRFPPRTP
ncbi:hypothetical protein AB0399_21325 [Streptomyces sp. NPDC088194]